MTQSILQFSYLQVLDLLTTVAFLLLGVEEGNPIVRWALQATNSPLLGLLLVKVVALLLGAYCWHQGHLRLLARINIAFAALVIWNLLTIIVQTAAEG